MSERIAGVVLAAGGSSRWGRPKQLLTVGGEPLVRRAAVQALAACDEVFVVVGAIAEQVAGALAGLPLRVVINRAWADGVGGSIACGARAALADGSGGILVMLADQPLVNAGHLNAMIARLRETGAPAVAAFYDHHLGVPAVFAGRVAGELAMLTGPEGARRLLARWGAEVEPFDLPDAAFDVDVEDDVGHVSAPT